MAFPSTLRLGREAVVKTMQLKAWGLREFASAVFFSTKSEGSEKGKQKKSKMQQPPQSIESAESFGNSTYKNLQHHNYNTYTFLDFHLDLLKFRLPQPSSGRESPRH
ncbi:NADH dehydrogenase [ubiquinone] flavoprotein 3, mitochondrial isoform X2 [Gracilinanus agilis]|uniref:NADH dehydrogenase [ubiquinone] flavoprotein 3, mitochondrial isoform X2 n=1 Tax=Gracilinanus agilis TaxID=191870 RepID=UPI001CFE7990|nr:NADH dehydrogenase [ubiquinone] flavoprotein 3, mitochondrial isoform X2 [Gracilinanus agilis]